MVFFVGMTTRKKAFVGNILHEYIENFHAFVALIVECTERLDGCVQYLHDDAGNKWK